MEEEGILADAAAPDRDSGDLHGLKDLVLRDLG